MISGLLYKLIPKSQHLYLKGLLETEKDLVTNKKYSLINRKRKELELLLRDKIFIRCL